MNKLLLFICFMFIHTHSLAETTLLSRADNGAAIIAPDPHVILDNGTYYMYATAGDGNYEREFGSGKGDIPIWTANNIKGPWTKLSRGVFGYDGDGRDYSNKNLYINNAWYRSIWGPNVIKLGTNSYMLSFTATRHGHSITEAEQPGGREMGVYLAWSNSPKGPFAPYSSNHLHEPFPVAAPNSCPRKSSVPHSVEWATPGCQGGECKNTLRLDVNILKDAGDYWMGYSWYEGNSYEHTSIVKLNRQDPFSVDCNAQSILIGKSNNSNLINKLKESCDKGEEKDKCKKMLSFTQTHGENDGGGVIEGPSIFKHGEYFYVLQSGSDWNSAYYHVYWIASKTIAGLSSYDSNRLVGRFLVPGTGRNGQRYAFGTGSVLKDKSGRWQYVYGGLIYDECRDLSNGCGRYALVSPIEFVDKDDGKGKVHIKTIYPVEELGR